MCSGGLETDIEAFLTFRLLGEAALRVLRSGIEALQSNRPFKLGVHKRKRPRLSLGALVR
jgi:hypothetical protein